MESELRRLRQLNEQNMSDLKQFRKDRRQLEVIPILWNMNTKHPFAVYFIFTVPTVTFNHGVDLFVLEPHVQ